MSLNMSLTDAFTAVFRQSPMPIQLEVERTLNSSNGLAHGSHQLGKLFENTINCNIQHEKGDGSYILPSNPCQLFSWIIKPVPNTVGVCVEGKKSLEEEEYWHSGLVVKRLSSTVIETNSGSRYELMGDIVFLDALDADIPEALAECFMEGFPENWESLINKYLSSNTSTVSNNVASTSPPDALLEITDLVSQQSTDRNYQNYQKKIPNQEYVRKDMSSTSWLDNTQNTKNQYLERQNGRHINDENMEISRHGQVPGNRENVDQQQQQQQQYISRINSKTGVCGHQLLSSQKTQNVVRNNDFVFQTQNTVVPTENGLRNLKQVANDDNEEMTEICMGGDSLISNSDSLISKTVLGKQLGKMKKSNTRSQKYESVKKKKQKSSPPPSLIETDDTEDSYTQDRTPYSLRQKRRILTDDESETNNCASSSTYSKSHNQYKKRAKIEKRQTRSSSKSDTVASASSNEDSENNKQSGNNRDLRKNSADIGGKSRTSINASQNGSTSNLEKDSVENSESRMFSLTDWIIRPMKKLRCVLVEGKRKGIEAYWRSSSIAERRDPKTVVTNSGSVYKLVGNIQDMDAVEAGFHPKLVKSFTRGFPKNWQKLIEMHFNGEFEDDEVRLKPKKKDIDRSIEQSILNETLVGTPGGQLIDLTEIKQTRSGRIVKPVLANWMGQRVKYDPHLGKMRVVYNTKFAKDVYTKEAVQLSSKMMRAKFSKKISTPNPVQQPQKPTESKENDELSQKVMKETTKGKTGKKVTNTTVKKRKNSASTRLTSDCETDSLTENESNKKKNSKNIPRNEFNSDFSEPAKKTASSSGEAFDIWGVLEKKRLDHALRVVPPNDTHLWKRLADAVRTRTEDECKEYLKSEKKYADFVSRIKPEKERKLVEITAKKGTFKRRQQIKALIEQMDVNEEDFDPTEATPYRNRTKKMPQVDIDDEELFGGDFPITPASQAYRTPTFKHCLQMFSAKKTPSNVQADSSPVNNTVRKKNAEKVVHNYLKQLKKDKSKPVKKAPVAASNKPRTLFRSKKMVDGSIFNIDENKIDDGDEDEESDHYFSDESITD